VSAISTIRLVSWTGALAFVASLAYGIRAYVVHFSDVAPAGSPWLGPAAVNLLLFTAFALHHSVLARTGIKQRVVRVVGAALERPLYIWLSSALFFLCCWLWLPLPGVLYAWPPSWEPWLVGVQWVGGAVTAVAARRLDVLALAGVRQPDANAPPRPLETSGLYGLVRHPIYFGWILLVLPAPVMTCTRAAFAFISIAYLVAAVPFEERGLVAMYGDAYRDYQRKVRARLVPGVY
jgi:protein-S-isoprenylcysteine O-methyltransferase Ste14